MDSRHPDKVDPDKVDIRPRLILVDILEIVGELSELSENLKTVGTVGTVGRTVGPSDSARQYANVVTEDTLSDTVGRLSGTVGLSDCRNCRTVG